MCLAAGIWLEGVNFAIGSGAAAGRTVHRPCSEVTRRAAGLAGYRTRLESSFVLADHRKFRDAPHLVMGDLAQQQLPALACGVAERMFRVDNPEPKPGLRRIVMSEMQDQQVRWRDAVSEGLRALRTFG